MISSAFIILIFLIFVINLFLIIFFFKIFSSFNTRLDALSQLFQGSLTQQFLQLTQSLGESLTSSRKELKEALSLLANSLQERVERLRALNEARLEDLQKNVETRLIENMDRNIKVVKEMTERLTDLRATTQRIVEISQDLNQLSSILQSPKLRGNIGEFELENMLKQILPPDHFQVQAQLGEVRVDALIYLKEGLLCIDSKFPLENFRRMSEPNLLEEEKRRYSKEFYQDVKRHIDALASKYIIPDTTLDFAFMFIPAESVYYEIILNPELHSYALEKKIIPVSPNSLYAYLQTVAIGLRGMKIEEEARRIEQTLLALKKEFNNFKEHFRLLGRHLDNARSQFNYAEGEVQNLENRFNNLSLPGDLL